MYFGLETGVFIVSMRNIESWKRCQFIDDETANADITAGFEVLQTEMDKVDDCEEEMKDMLRKER